MAPFHNDGGKTIYIYMEGLILHHKFTYMFMYVFLGLRGILNQDEKLWEIKQKDGSSRKITFLIVHDNIQYIFNTYVSGFP